MRPEQLLTHKEEWIRELGKLLLEPKYSSVIISVLSPTRLHLASRGNIYSLTASYGIGLSGEVAEISYNLYHLVDSSGNIEFATFWFSNLYDLLDNIT